MPDRRGAGIRVLLEAEPRQTNSPAPRRRKKAKHRSYGLRCSVRWEGRTRSAARRALASAHGIRPRRLFREQTTRRAGARRVHQPAHERARREGSICSQKRDRECPEYEHGGDYDSGRRMPPPVSDLGYEQGERTPGGSVRIGENGASSKTLATAHGQVSVEVPAGSRVAHLARRRPRTGFAPSGTVMA
jgi:hypothetical protein